MQNTAPLAVAFLGAAVLACGPGALAQTQAYGPSTLPVSIAAKLKVVDPPAPDSALRDIDYSEVLARVRLAYGPGAQMTEPSGKKSKGDDPDAASVLWRMDGAVAEDEPLWCRVNLDPGAGKIFLNRYFCFVDRDKDGRFDRRYAIVQGGPPWRLMTRGKISARDTDPIPYKISETPAAPDEKLTLRYMGPIKALVGPDGKLTEALLRFELDVGPNLETSHEAASYAVRIRSGQGRLVTSSGFVVDIADVEVDGRARMQVLATPPVGDISLFEIAKPRR